MSDLNNELERWATGVGQRKITAPEWEATYRPINQNEPLDRVPPVDVHWLWTQVEDGEGGEMIVCGPVTVNRIGFWLTQEPWTDTDRVTVLLEFEETDGEDDAA